eukprot:CAMPEP_0197184792 /NCGR_PEP_ID=MMETSP1423-20130617/10594_1 /TAXON_ID=476441 /ORGANISM="Pseudo-nitzschia heimii, Strain UNC1101" /LENGTH=1857 /DNA_ID=CAMNT_0042635697 /DNA_START=86 /DNA_END=5659 /DNA_ORIENTATION=+
MEEDKGANTSTKNFQDEVRQWFTGLSSEERAAALGFEDDYVVAILVAHIASQSPTSSTAIRETNDVSCEEQQVISIQDAQTSSLTPKRTTDKLFPNEICDWEASISIETIEQTWDEIMIGKSLARNDKEKNCKPFSHDNSEERNELHSKEYETRESSVEQKSCVDECKNLNNNEIVSDFRIPDERVNLEGKSSSTEGKSVDGDQLIVVCTATRDNKSGEQEEKGKTNDITDANSSPTSAFEKEIHKEYASLSPISTETFPATANTFKSSSARNGIGTDEQYPSQSNKRRIFEVMDNTRCIFPAASKVAAAAIIGEQVTSRQLLEEHRRKQKHPFITINPSFLHSLTGDELLVTLDEIMAMAYTDSASDDPCSFILPEEATSASWIDLVRSYLTTDTALFTSSSLQSIPLYILVLSRFQYSLASSYADRNDVPSLINDQIGDLTLTSYKASAKWLSALITRIHFFDNAESTEEGGGESMLASKSVMSEIFVEGNQKTRKYKCQDYLFLPFAVVAERLNQSQEISHDHTAILEEIDSDIEKSLRECWIIAMKESSDKANLSGLNSGAQSGDRAKTDSGAGSRGSDNINITKNSSSTMSTSGGKKGKKKKKKKKRKGSAGASQAMKTNSFEKLSEAKMEEKRDSDDKRNQVEVLVETSLVETSTEIKDPKQNDSVANGTQLNQDAHAIQPKQLVAASVTSDDETPDVEKNILEHPGKSNKSSSIQLPQADESVSSVKVQLKQFNDEVNDLTEKNLSKEIRSTDQDDYEDEWETVEIRTRGRKKVSDKGNNTRIGLQNTGNNGGTTGQNLTHFKKKAPRTKETRARTKTRKMVREILGGVLDAVEDKVRRRRTVSRERQHGRRNQTSFGSANNTSFLKNKNPSTPSSSNNSNSNKKTGSSLRDILVRGKIHDHNQQTKIQSTTKSTSFSYSERARSLISDSNGDKNNVSRKKNEKPSLITGQKTTNALKAARAIPADQNTIPTIASTNSAFTPSVNNIVSRKSGVALSSDSSESETPKPKNSPSDPVLFASPSPPLPTLLSPGNNNSTSSSVASSLDAPLAGHNGNKSRQSENDVGCHLLNVCDRLSSEIAIFMKRREIALKIRRHERSLVLAALEKTLCLIWPGKASVEMYGSCATNLDLPSSDLDVVVCGLDRPFVEACSSKSPSILSNSLGRTSCVEDLKNREDGSRDLESAKDGSLYASDKRYSRHQITPYQMQMMYGHVSLNAERVLRLAMELEHQPWAVHVKAIPTASVPVIKILADPARLQGALMNANTEWLVQQPISGKSPPINRCSFPDNTDPRVGNQAPMSHFRSQQSSPLWRGADVVNGLLKVDITFEGPEHGGIGSTRFSKKVIEDFSSETGLSPECTPQVQVLMVLKELLAQRRSNEPFSGGLSSYALLLLVISMIGERSLIREELEKTERQRRVVAAGGDNSALRSISTDMMESTKHELKQSSGNGQIPKNVLQLEEFHSQSLKASFQQSSSVGINTRKVKEAEKNSIRNERLAKIELEKFNKKAGPILVPPPSQPKLQGASSWASIARNKSSSMNPALSKKKIDVSEKDSSETKSEQIPDTQSKVSTKPSSFADAVAKGKPAQVDHTNLTNKTATTLKKNEGNKRFDGLLDPPSSKTFKSKSEKEDSIITKMQQQKGKLISGEEKKILSNATISPSNKSKRLLNATVDNITDSLDSSGFPQGFHDVIEVLCSGEITPGKLLMHFLLFYGQHFESQSTAIDYSGVHHRDPGANNGYSVRSSYMLRRNAGSYDPVSGMYTVDPIVVYDPLEGAENNNVARSCFAWSSIRWVFAQSYMTLSSAAEQNASDGNRNRAMVVSGEGPAYGHDESGHVVVDPSSPLLELLISF